MKFDNPKYVERYEDVIFEPQVPVNAEEKNGQHQKMKTFRFVVDNTDEVTVFNWNRARLYVDFKVNLLADGAVIMLVDQNGIVNGAHSLIRDLRVTINVKKLYDCNQANHCVNIKNMLEYSPAYAESLGTNELFYVDTSRNAEERPAQAAYNKGFAARKARLGTSSTVITEIPLNRYSFFERLEDELLPDTRVELNFETEKDGNVIWQAGADCRAIITRMQLIIPTITFNDEGLTEYMSTYLVPHKWTYLRENVQVSGNTQQRSGNFRITSGINKPRHAFVFIINADTIDDQTKNSFLYDTFAVSTDPRNLVRCSLEVGNGTRYPDVEYSLATDPTRVYRDLMSYAHKVSEFQLGSPLNVSNFESLYPFIYFDLTHQRQEVRDGVTKLTFHYELSDTTTGEYNIYAMTLYEQEVELYQVGKKVMIRS